MFKEKEARLNNLEETYKDKLSLEAPETLLGIIDRKNTGDLPNAGRVYLWFLL